MTGTNGTNGKTITPTSTPVIVGGLVALGALATAAILFTQGDASLQRLALLFGMFGVVVSGLIAALRADHAATQTSATSNIAAALDGDFELRVQAAVKEAMAERRRAIAPPATPASEDPIP